MNKLLRNPWVVAALVAGMAALWWVQMRGVFSPGADAGTPATVAATPALPAASGAAVSSDEAIAIEPLTPAPAHGPTQLRWDSTPIRDPFGPVAVAAPPEPPPAVEEAPAETVAIEPVATLPALEAVLNTPSAHIAVIDGRIVRVGDKVAGRAVIRIGAASVALGGNAVAQEPLELKLPAR
jgi:hypothetical protein